MLEFEVKNQTIKRTDTFNAVADSRNYLRAKFSLSEEWQGDVVAVFGYGGSFFQLLLDEAESCIVPFEVIKAPGFTVSLFCGEERLVTANVLWVGVEKSGLEDGEVPQTPTPTVWQQYMKEMQELIDNGLPYIGDDGNWWLYNTELKSYEDTGITANGYTPQRSVDYWTEEDKAEIKSDVAPFVVNIAVAGDGSITVDKTFEEITAAHNDGRVVLGIHGISVLTLITLSASVVGFLQIINEGFCIFFCNSSDVWSTSVVNIARKEYVDESIQSAILESWGTAI